MRKNIFLIILSAIGLLYICGCGKAKVYTIVFNANGGSGEMKAQTFADGVEQALIANIFSRDNYNFTGWNTMADGTGLAYSDKQEIILTDDITLYAQWEIFNMNGHTYVDLGLPSGNLWATCNVGAVSPEDFGNYFAWAETSPKETYNWSTYRYTVNGSDSRFTKYCGNQYWGNEGFTDTLTTLEAMDDAATINWGAGWRTPEYYEFTELRANCSFSWTTSNGVNGVRITGPNGNNIFLPAAGCASNDEVHNVDSSCCYWSSSYDQGYPDCARSYIIKLTNQQVNQHTGITLRFAGYSVRPVCSRK